MNKLSLSYQICFPLYALSRQFTQLYRPYLDKLGLTYPQYLVMLVMWERQQLTVKALGEQLLLDSGTLTPLLKRMEEKELLVRTRSREDERVVMISLTAEGKALRKKALQIPEQLQCRLELTDTAATELRAQLQQLLEKTSRIAAQEEQ